MASVVFLSTSPVYGGVEKNVVLRGRELASRGHRVLVATDGGDNEARVRAAGLETVPVRRGGDLDLLALGRYVRRLGREKPDALFVATKKDFWLGALASRVVGVPRTILYLGIERRFRRWPKYGLVFRRLPTRLLVNSVSLRQRVLASSPFIPPDRVHVIRNGFVIPEDRSRSAEFRDRLGVPPDAVLIGGAGRLSYQKGFDRLPDLWARLGVALTAGAHPAKVRDLRFVVAGDGEARAELEGAVRDRGLERHILFPGRLEVMAEFYRAIDLFVLPSRYEGMANVLNEAMSYGVPVVATDVSGSAELLLNGALGPVVPVDDLDALAQACAAQIAAGLERSDELVEHIRTHYSLERMIDETEALLFG